MKKLALLAAGAAAFLTLPQTAAAQDNVMEPGDFLLRSRMIVVSPEESATVNIGGALSVDDAITPELDLTYFWTSNFATELIAASPRHSILVRSSAIGRVDVGSVNLLPPTLLLQYHQPLGDRFKPYVGAGINYTWFFNEDGRDVSIDSVDDGFGFALQGGMDFFISDRLFINVDLKRLWLNTDATLAGGVATADIDIDPWIYGIGVGFKF